MGISLWSWGFLCGVGDFSAVLDQEKCVNRVGVEAESFGCVAGFRVEVIWLLVRVLFSCLSLGVFKDGGLGWSFPHSFLRPPCL